MHFANPGGLWVSGLLLIGFALLIALGVRQALSVPLRERRVALVLLRVLSGALALLFALQPQWITERVQNVQGRLVVLVDASRSMSVRDVAPSRAQRALDLLRHWAGQSKQGFDVYAFGSDAHAVKLAGLDAAQLSQQDDTRIQQAVER